MEGRLAYTLLVITLYASPGTPVDLDLGRFEQKVSDFVEAGLKCHNNPGLSLSVVKSGRIILAKGFGHKATDKLEPVTNETLFGIASLSKAFAATLILKQIEKNESLSLSTQIRKLLGQEDIFEDYLRSKYATLEDLLAHRIGLPSNNNLRLDDKLTRKSLVGRLKFLSPKGGFRTSFYYSNLMYGLITYISELIGGKTWEALVKEEIFDPLDMTSSTFLTSADPGDLDLAVGYQDRYGALFPVPFEFSRRWGLLCGSGCILSNAVDMANWMMFHLHNGRNIKNINVLDPDILSEAHKAQNSITYNSVKKYYSRPSTPVTLSQSNYGLGWKLGHYRGFEILQHTGSTYGYRAMLTLIPGMDAGVFVALTGDDPDYLFRTNIHLYIADHLLGYDPWLDNTTVCSFPEPWKQGSTSKTKYRPSTDITSDRPLTEYEGTFSNKAYGNIEIHRNHSVGFLLANFGFGEFILYPKSTADVFYAQGYGLLENIRDFSTLQFAFKNGKVVTLTIPSMESKDPPVFRRTERKEPIKNQHMKRSNGCCCCCASNCMFTAIYIIVILCITFY